MGCTTSASILEDDVMVSEDQGHKRGNTPSTTFLFPSEAEPEHEKHERPHLRYALTNRVNVLCSSGTFSIYDVLHAELVLPGD
jgi:hypothetical protein